MCAFLKKLKTKRSSQVSKKDEPVTRPDAGSLVIDLNDSWQYARPVYKIVHNPRRLVCIKGG